MKYIKVSLLVLAFCIAGSISQSVRVEAGSVPKLTTKDHKPICDTVTSVIMESNRDMAMVSAIIMALDTFQMYKNNGYKQTFIQVVQGGQTRPASTIMWTNNLDAKTPVFSFTRMVNLIPEHDIQVLSLQGSPEPYVVMNFSLIKRSADKVNFNVQKDKGVHYSYTLDDFYGEGDFTFHDDQTVEAKLCEDMALRPMSTGLIVDARHMDLNSGESFRIESQNGTTIYEGQVAVYKETEKKTGSDELSPFIDPFIQVKNGENHGAGWNAEFVKVVALKSGKTLVISNEDSKHIASIRGMKEAIAKGRVAVVQEVGESPRQEPHQ